MELAEKVKALRAARHWSVADLARESGVSKPYIWQIESGARKNPTAEVVRRLAGALGTTVADLVGVPETVSPEALAEVPESLRVWLRARGRRLGVVREDVEVLKGIHYRGRRPETSDDWELIYLFLRRILG